jgi:nucleotide-binding universal stress UspA family protein
METQQPRESTPGPAPGNPLFRNVLLPIASLEDAEETCLSAMPAIRESNGSITALHIIDASGGWPDMAPREYRRYIANDALELVRREGDAVGVMVATRVVFDGEVTRAIIETAAEIGASAIVFTPRGSGRWRSLFSTGVAFDLVKKATCPVIVFPATGRTRQ